MQARRRGIFRLRLLVHAFVAPAMLIAPAALIATVAPAAAQQRDPLQELLDTIGHLLVGSNGFDSRLLAIVSIATALGFVVFLMASLFIAIRRRTSGSLRRQHDEIVVLRAELDQAEALLEAQDQLCLLLHPDGPTVHGSLAGVDELPREGTAILAFRTWLEPQSAHMLVGLVAALTGKAQLFRTIARTRDGLHLEVQGLTAGGNPVLILRNISGDQLEHARLHDRFVSVCAQAELLKKLLDATPSPSWIRDDNGGLVWVNAAYGRAAGSGNITATPPRELLEERARAAIERQLAAGKPFVGQIQSDIAGRRATFEVSAVRDDKASAALARDISEIEDTRDDLSRHVEAHARTLDRISTAVAIFDAEQKLSYSNAAYRTLWRLDESWLASAPTHSDILDALREMQALPSSPDYRSWKAKQLAPHARRPLEDESWFLPDGRALRVAAEPHPHGGVTYLFDDVTEKIALESRHNALINVQRETLDNLNEGVALFASDGRLRLYNPAFAKLWRLTTSELDKGPRIDQVISWSRVLMDEPTAWETLKARITALDEGRVPDAIRFERPDGSVIDCLTVPLPGGGTLVTYMDVTDAAMAERALKEHNEALEEADEIKTKFIHHVSYVLRAPLTTIIGYADLLARDAMSALNSKQREYMHNLLTSSHALLAIINDILDIATIDSGIMELDLAPVDITSVMETAADGVRDRLQENNVELVIEQPDDLGTFIADGKRLAQVLFNLLANAIAFSTPGGRIFMGCQRKGDDVILSVADRGKGIAPERQQAVFDRFESQPSSSGQRGSGIGLSIVKSLVELHGGEVRLASTPGEGTRVDCVLPISPDAAARRPRPTQLAQKAQMSLVPEARVLEAE